MMHQGGHH
uniref:Uncharacterized protein n=1 Tax=Anguilla anguilla TaxID=7936 RepID=A0A0E9T4U0_ANGAN